MTDYALKFISGKHRGKRLKLSLDGDIVLGRSSEIDVVLTEEMVSRRHARIFMEKGLLKLEDFGSTNGTFVNGEKISRVSIKPGDRVLIGTTIMKLVDMSKESVSPGSDDTGIVSRLGKETSGAFQKPKTVTSHGQSVKYMTGTISEIPLPDLLQLFSSSKKTGTLVLKRGYDTGKIHIKTGKLVYASLSSSPEMSPLKVIFRLLTWEDGTFELIGFKSFDETKAIDMPTEHILIEGLRQLDELKNMQDKPLPPETELMIVTPLLSRLSELSKEQLDIFQIVYNYGTAKEIYDRSQINEKDISLILNELLNENYITKV